jgi:predicted SprT family Zn-dependent metalloprotease
MTLICSDCGGRIWKTKNLAREHHDWNSGETRYRCRECQAARVWIFIERTRDALGLQARP